MEPSIFGIRRPEMSDTEKEIKEKELSDKELNDVHGGTYDPPKGPSSEPSRPPPLLVGDLGAAISPTT